MLQKRKSSAYEDVTFINGVCEILIEMSEKLPELNLDSDVGSRFIYNIPTGETWMNERVEKLSVAATLKLEEDINGSDYRFVKLLDSLRSKLLDLNYVQENIKSGQDALIEEYLAFFCQLPANELRMAVSIKRYLDQLSNEKKVSAEFIKFRTDFMYDYYDTLSEGEQKKITGNRAPEEVFYGEDVTARAGTVDETVKTFHKPEKNSGKALKKANGIIIWAVAFGLISALLLLVPPLIISLSVGGFAERFLNFFEPWYALIPVCTFTVCIVSYLLCKKGDRIAVAAKLTALLCVLPVAFYILSYLLFYYVRVSLIF